MGAGNLSSGSPECAVSTPPVQASSPACGFMLDVLYFSLCFSDGIWCFGKLWQLRGIGALQAPMKGRLAPSPGWLFSRSPSMIFMKSGLRVGASFPQGVTPQSAPFMVSLQTSVLCGLHSDGQPGRPGCSSPASFLHLVYNKSWEDPVSTPPLPCCPTFCNLSTIRQPGDPSSPPFSLDSDSFLQKPQAMCVRKTTSPFGPTIRTELALESSPSLPSLVPSSHLIDFPPLFHSWFPQLYNSPTLFLHFVRKLP